MILLLLLACLSVILPALPARGASRPSPACSFLLATYPTVRASESTLSKVRLRKVRLSESTLSPAKRTLRTEPSRTGQPSQLGPPGQLGQPGQLDQIGHLGQPGRTTQAGQVGRFGQLGRTGQIGLIGQCGQMGPIPYVRLVRFVGLARFRQTDPSPDHSPARVVMERGPVMELCHRPVVMETQ